MLRFRMANSSSRSLPRRSISARSMARARSSLSTPCRLNTRTSTIVPATPGRQAQGGVAHVGGLFAEDGAQQLFFRRHRAFALGRDLADQDVARQDLGADRHDARFVEVAQGFLADVGDVAGDFFRTQLGVAGHDLELLDVDRGEDVVAHDALGDQDRVFEVVAIPGHEGDEGVAAQGQFAQLGRRAVGDDVAGVDLVAHPHQRTLVDAGVLVGALELRQAVDVDARLGRVGLFGGADDDPGAVDLLDHAGAAGDHHGAGVAGHHVFHAGADQRRVRLDQRHGLASACSSPSGRGWRHRFPGTGSAAAATETTCLGDTSIKSTWSLAAGSASPLIRPGTRSSTISPFVELDVGLGDDVLGLFHGRHVDDLVGGLAVLDPAVRALDEAVLVDHARGWPAS